MKKDIFLSKNHLTQLLRPQLGSEVEVLSVVPYEIDNSASILVTLTAQQTDRCIGHFGLSLSWRKEGKLRYDRLVLKVKPPGAEIAAMLASLAAACDPELGEVYADHIVTTGFANTHLREIEVYKDLPHPIHPKFVGYRLNQAEDQYELLIEDLSGFELLNTVMNVEHWSTTQLRRALFDVADWHVFAKAEMHVLNDAAWLDTDHENYWQQEAPLWGSLLRTGNKHFPAFYATGLYEVLHKGLDQIDELSRQFVALPKTLIHNDTNPRNACFRADGSFCLYDWELSCRHVPVYDVIELLSFVLEQDRFDQIGKLLEYYRRRLIVQWGVWREDTLWRQSLYLAWYVFGWHRLGMYTMAHAVSPYPFLPRVFRGYAAIGRYLNLLN